ncbi:MAG TPA: hypothetical protein PK667_11800 [Nitrosomonas europaea]|nr:hypothetical protein [Nitrosomonas europaea]HUM74855.1 hypothetical protein [Nitrosomonas europaea]
MGYVRILIIPGFLSADCYQDGVQKNGNRPRFSCCYKDFVRESKLPARRKEEEIAQAKESPLRSGNHRGLYVHVAW